MGGGILLVPSAERVVLSRGRLCAAGVVDAGQGAVGDQVDALLAAPDASRWEGRRDRTLLYAVRGTQGLAWDRTRTTRGEGTHKRSGVLSSPSPSANPVGT